MADRMQYQAPSIFTSTTPQVTVDDGTAEYLKTTSAVFLNNANEAHKRQIASDIDYAQKQGEKLGFKAGKDFRPMKSGSLFARQFNESGIYNASQRVNSQSQKKISTLIDQNIANPEGLATAITGWSEGFVEELPDEMQTPFLKNIEVLSTAAIDKANAERKVLTAQSAAADFYTYERDAVNTMEKLAPLTFKPGPEGDSARAALATVRQNYVEMLSGNGPEGEYDVGGYNVKAAPGRSGAFDPLEIQKKIVAFDNSVIAAGVFGDFQEKVQAGSGAEAYMTFAKGDMEISTFSDEPVPAAAGKGDIGLGNIDDPVPPIDEADLADNAQGTAPKGGRDAAPPRPDQGGMSGQQIDQAANDAPPSAPVSSPGQKATSIPGVRSKRISDILTNDEMAELEGRMRTYIGGINSVEEGEYRKWERGRDMYNDQALSEAYQAGLEVVDDGKGNKRIIGGNPVALQNVIAAAVENPLIKPETVDKLQRLANDLGTGQIDNPVTIGETWTGISTGDIYDYRSIPTTGISDKTRIEMYNAIDTRVKGQHWSNSNRYKIAEDYADAVLAPAKSAGFSLLGDADSAAAADRAEWNKRMITDILAAEAAGALPSNPNAMPSKNANGPEFDFVSHGRQIADEIAAKRNKPAAPEVVEVDTQIKTIEDQMNNPKKGDDVEAIKEQYRLLQERKSQLQSRAAMGIQ